MRRCSRARFHFQIPLLRFAFAFLIVATLFAPARAQSDGRIYVAVMDLELTGDMPQTYARPLSDRLRSELIQTGRFMVIERNAMEDILDEQGFQVSGCSSDECAVEAGKLLGVTQIINGSVALFGQTYTINVRVIDVESGRILDAKSQDCTCPIEQVLTTSIRAVAYMLAGLDPGVAAPAALSSGVAVSGRGDLYVSEPKGADLFLDGEQAEGQVPYLFENIIAGSHTVRVRDGNLLGERQVFVAPEEMTTVSVKMEIGHATLRILSDPFGATVTLDGREIGTTPQILRNVATGQHTVRLTMEGRDPAERTVTLKPGEEERLKITLFDLRFVLIPAGSYIMGSPRSEKGRGSDEGPKHRVTISEPFQMMTTEVTQAQWKAVMGSNPSEFKGDDRPVENVSWYDVQKFIKKLNQRNPGKGYRLPTEAEWEYACRAGTKTRFYEGKRDSDLDRAGWYDGNSGGKTHPVGQKKPNAWGLYDMHGNVWEWCEDWYHDSYRNAPTDGSAWTNPPGSSRVLRGGSWGFDDGVCRSAVRGRGDPGFRSHSSGFRIVRSSPSY